MDDFIGCKIEKQGNEIHLSQPDLIHKLMKSFKQELIKQRNYTTPAATGVHVLRSNEIETKLSTEEQKKYRSAVGSLLYLLKHWRPDLSNVVRELSKVMDGAAKAHQKMLYRVLSYVQTTADRKLILWPNDSEKWELKGFCDSDFAGDADTRRSVSGFIIYLMGCPIAWKSKG